MGWIDLLFPPALGEAEIRVLPPAGGATLRVQFVLESLRITKTNEFAEVNAPGLNGQPLQFVRGHTRTLSVTLHFDGRAADTDVRQPMNQIRSLMQVDRDTHAPPLLSFDWSTSSLRCVLESMTQEFTSAFADGRPSRGRIRAIFRESLSLEQLLEEAGRQ